jgi:hypothetical protein
MAYFIVDLVLFFLVLFVLLPGIMAFAMSMRGIIYRNQHRKHAGWHKEVAGKSTF